MMCNIIKNIKKIDFTTFYNKVLAIQRVTVADNSNIGKFCVHFCKNAIFNRYYLSPGHFYLYRNHPYAQETSSNCRWVFVASSI